ncbi:myosin light chain kinase family member 4-like [Paramacrobiotus metropolitanus]|uniref:myosin light chain kinase family member 4-like n=1 Tax=Paramacrobiotus metropolitanus TaxID=2943436 RepID=UPI00244614B4|nr:myosin light chain kinase family member 4-like [Paramacrobiotus metropolitanus]XP_055327529.1 myosin light chain kinase family member 4-like [Paramacrobiotus metropolitanus]
MDDASDDIPEIRTELVDPGETDDNCDTGDDCSTSLSLISPCPSPCGRNHIHRQHRPHVYDISDDELDTDDDEPPFEPRDVHIIKDKPISANYDLMEALGKGKFGVVYKCAEKSSGRQFAAKFIEVKRPIERKEVEGEINIMKELQHPRLLQLYDAYDDGYKMAIVMELATGGELFNRVIDDEFVLTEKICTIFMRQICEGVEFMHSKNIIHLDMKPENILCVSPNSNRIKLIDFGLARKFSPKDCTQVLFGTPEFVAPEVINYDRITLSTDMWSVGVICYILLSGLSPFMGDNDMETLNNVTNAAWDFDDECFDAISEDAKDFITRLLVKRPEKRMTATQCLEHRWLQMHAPPEADVAVKEAFMERRKSLGENEISKIKLRHFVIRRRWQKIVNTIRALRRMGVQRCASADTVDDPLVAPSPTYEQNKTSFQLADSSLGGEISDGSVFDDAQSEKSLSLELVLDNVEMSDALSEVSEDPLDSDACGHLEKVMDGVDSGKRSADGDYLDNPPNGNRLEKVMEVDSGTTSADSEAASFKEHNGHQVTVPVEE